MAFVAIFRVALYRRLFRVRLAGPNVADRRRTARFVEKSREIILRRRIKGLTWIFIVGLVLAGATAIPLKSEVDLLANIFGASEHSTSPLAAWIWRVQTALTQTSAQFPFLFYGTDWLAFGHFAIAIAFIGALRAPVRNCWLYTFGMIACVLIIPYALIFGGLRGIPQSWRLIDCSFGVFGFIPVWLCRKWVQELENQRSETLKGETNERDKVGEAARF
jgi:hypothetical protein